jgi:hypothetical protein
MPGTRLSALALPAALCTALLSSPVAAGPQPGQPPADKNKFGEDGDVEVRFIDNSALKLKLLDDKVELITKHGTLRIAIADIRKIEFSSRVPPEMAEKVVTAIGRLNHSDFKVREAATEELKGYKARAYPQLVKALKSDDPEVSRRAEEIVKFIKTKVPATMLELREQDVVHTEDSKIAGRLTAEYLRVGTFQFGEQRLKLSDLHGLRTGASAAEEQQLAAMAGPAHMGAYANQFGKEYLFTVVGVAAGGQGSVWGTDAYTLDSHFPSAVVHAGLAKPGETVTVRVRIVQSPPAFGASTRNGVTSTAYGPYNGGAYEFVRK